MMGPVISVGFWLSEGTFPAIIALAGWSAVFTQHDKQFMVMVENWRGTGSRKRRDLAPHQYYDMSLPLAVCKL